ncbi:hypothetical protein [Methylorubrum aminovorans]
MVVLEHIPHAFAVQALVDWAWLLAPDGKLVMQTSYLPGLIEIMASKPSFENDHNFMLCLFGNQMHPGDFHHVCFTKQTLGTYLVAAGFHTPKFTFRDKWLIACVAEKAVDFRDELSAFEDDETYGEKAFEYVLKRQPEPFHIEGLRKRSETAESRRILLRELISSPENSFRIGASLDQEVFGSEFSPGRGFA